MLNFLKSKENKRLDDHINDMYAKLKAYCHFDELTEDRKNYLKGLVSEYGYLSMPHLKVLEEFSAADTLFALEKKWEDNGVFKDGHFCFENNELSPLSRNNVQNSDWIKKEGHDIKLINLAGLGNGNYSETAGKFFDWVKQILILPTGDVKKNIFNTTIYLIPFHPREFGCAYLPTSSTVSPNLNDEFIEKELGLNAEEQVKLFIQLAQLAGHPVIYDVLPQLGRFAKNVLVRPTIARWFNIPELMNKIEEKVEIVASELSKTLNEEDVEVVKSIYLQTLKSGAGELSDTYLEIYKQLDEKLVDYKKEISRDMCKEKAQNTIHKKVEAVISRVEGKKTNKIQTEDDITKQSEIIETLISEGLWPAPGGAWCSAGVPIFDKMSECGGHPVFKHYDKDEKDVTNFANLDCQTPYYFVFLENGKYNKPVIKFFVDYMKNMQKTYGFDGFRVDHVDHVVDEISAPNGTPISYRAPSLVLQTLNETMKAEIPYFATLAEYMLWDKFYKEYHSDMKFDLLWGNDIICQSDKTPEAIVEDNQTLSNYNVDYLKSMLSILKTYNNQDGEFNVIDRYPAQLQESGALFKWFKYKFLPGGKFAQRPVMYVDGDESFTKRGIEEAIGSEISMKRNNDYEFFKKFDAINRLSKSIKIVTEGEAQIINQEEDGFVTWLISKEPLKNAILVIANYNAPTEKFTKDEKTEIKYGTEVYDKEIALPCDYKAVAEYVFDGKNYNKVKFSEPEAHLHFDVITPSQFKIFELVK